MNFRCKPFWYAAGVQDITITASGAMVTNPGSVFSEPVITVHGSGDITLMIGMGIVELEGLEGHITLDSSLQEAYSGATIMNDKMNGDFPVLKPGTNAVSWSEDVMNNTEVAYLSNNKLYVTQAEILTKLIIGKFALEPQANGNMSLIYNG